LFFSRFTCDKSLAQLGEWFTLFELAPFPRR